MKILIGQIFNWLTVIDGPIMKNGRKYWKCKCKCGKEKIIRDDSLKNGSTKSCGCYKNQIFIENNKKRQTLDLTNQKFGLLTAIKPTQNRKDGRVIWECKCDCGNVIHVDTHSLQQQKTLSCGCLRSKGELAIQKILEENNICFEQQKSFNSCIFQESGYLAKFDFYVNNKYIIEYDGKQHFKYDKNTHSWNTEKNLKSVQERDAFKNQWCKDNNIPLIRIPYTHYKDLCIEDLLLETSKFRVI